MSFDLSRPDAQDSNAPDHNPDAPILPDPRGLEPQRSGPYIPAAHTTPQIAGPSDLDPPLGFAMTVPPEAIESLVAPEPLIAPEPPVALEPSRTPLFLPLPGGPPVTGPESLSSREMSSQPPASPQQAQFPAPSPAPPGGPPLRRSICNKMDRNTMDIWGEGPPVVFVQGFPFNPLIWDRTARPLRSNYTVCVWGMPREGFTTTDGSTDVSLETQSQRFALMLERHFDGLPVAVVAHGLGAAIALHAHAQHGARYRIMILVGPVVFPPLLHVLQEQRQALRNLPARLHRALASELISSASSRRLSQDMFHALNYQWTSGQGQSAFYDQLPHRPSDEQIMQMGAISFPIHICYGSQDEWAVGDELEPLAFRGYVRLDHIPDSGHLVPVDQPLALLEYIRRCFEFHRTASTAD